MQVVEEYGHFQYEKLTTLVKQARNPDSKDSSIMLYSLTPLQRAFVVQNNLYQSRLNLQRLVEQIQELLIPPEEMNSSSQSDALNFMRKRASRRIESRDLRDSVFLSIDRSIKIAFHNLKIQSQKARDAVLSIAQDKMEAHMTAVLLALGKDSEEQETSGYDATVGQFCIHAVSSHFQTIHLVERCHWRLAGHSIRRFIQKLSA